MIKEYKLKFDNKKQADKEMKKSTDGVKSWEFDIKEIGIHKEYIYNEEDQEQEPEVVEYEGWHIDVVSSVELSFPEEFVVTPKNPIHAFSGVGN